MVGGMVTATLLSLLVLPAVYYLWQRQRLRNWTDSDNQTPTTHPGFLP
jgi:Cu(I)/Ag(I) efflux system membrane protein CusA/SilA